MWSRFFKHFVSPQFIDYLANTYPIRRAAQMTVSAYYRMSEKNHAAQQLLGSAPFRAYFKAIKDNVKKQIEDVKREAGKHKKWDADRFSYPVIYV